MVPIIDSDKIRLDRRKGQHILEDEGVIDRQIQYADLNGTETVLEIGPGLGALTFKLAERAKTVVAIENDPQMCSYLKDKIPKNVDLICADVLKIDLPEFQIAVSNLPYHISSQITFKLLDCDFQRAILMYQKEFARRLIAQSGDKNYSRLSVNVYYKAQCKVLEYVPREAFRPVPEVDSAIIELNPRSPPFPVENEDLFFELIKSLFGHRRKKIKNSVSNLVEKKLRESGNYSSSNLKGIIKELPFIDCRVESLSPEKIGLLADKLNDLVRDRGSG